MNHDVAVVGAGLVGGVFACASAKLGLRTALIESRPPPADHGATTAMRTTYASRSNVCSEVG